MLLLSILDLIIRLGVTCIVTPKRMPYTPMSNPNMIKSQIKKLEAYLAEAYQGLISMVTIAY